MNKIEKVENETLFSSNDDDILTNISQAVEEIESTKIKETT